MTSQKEVPVIDFHVHVTRVEEYSPRFAESLRRNWVGTKWIIEADLTACFDHIQHKTLMRLLKRRVQDRKLLGIIWQMLRAGIMEGTLFKKTREGTP